MEVVSIHEETAGLKKELLLDSPTFGMEGVVAELQTNWKTHKPPGQVKPRAIHSATRNPLVPLCEYVACKRRRVQFLERHILNSVEEFRERIEKLVLGPNDRLTTADVKDNFVVVKQKYLAEMAASILNAKDRKFVARIILLRLQNQFVEKHNDRG